MKNRLLICRCATAEMLDDESINAVVKGAKDAWVVDDLCALAGERDARLVEFANGSSVVVVACYERAVNWMLKSAGIEAEASVLNLHQLSTDEALEKINGLELSRFEAPSQQVDDPLDWPAWFPVIDYDRCSECNQCANFCLFGVFGSDENGRILVENPANCKNNCPACARVCPDAAIIFPKLDESPINGDEVTANAGGPTQVNVHQIMGQDLYQTLKGRRSTLKRRLLRKDALEQAKTERCACMCGDDKPCLIPMTPSVGKSAE